MKKFLLFTFVATLFMVANANSQLILTSQKIEGVSSDNLFDNISENQFVFTNSLNKPIVKIEIVSGISLIHMVSVDCTKRCILDVNKDALNKDLSFIFVDNNNKAVGRYLWKPGTQRSVVISSSTIAPYIYDRIKSSMRLGDSIFNLKLTKLFTDKNKDIISQLGNDYNSWNGSETSYYTDLNKRLQNISVNQVIPLSGTSVKMKAMAVSNNARISDNSGLNMPVSVISAPEILVPSKCAAKDTNFLLKLLSEAAEFIPGHFGVGLAFMFMASAETLEDGCQTNDEAIVNNINMLWSRISTIEEQLTLNNLSISNLENEHLKTAFATAIGNFNKNSDIFIGNANPYFLIFTSGKSDPNNYKSLEDFTQKEGGLRKLILSNGNLPFKNVFNNRTNLLNLYINLISVEDLKNLGNAFATVSDSLSKSPGNLPKQRSEANASIIVIANKVLLTSAIIKLALKDQINTVLHSKESQEWIRENLGAFATVQEYTNKDGKPSGQPIIKAISWEEASDYVDKLIDEKNLALNAIIGTQNKINLIAPLKGFPVALHENLIKIGCDSYTEKAVPRHLANISAWDPNGSIDNPEPFVEVTCQNTDASGNSGFYKSIYYYKKDGDNIANVFGAVVPLSMQSKYVLLAKTNATIANSIQNGPPAASKVAYDGRDSVFRFNIKSDYPLMFYSKILNAAPAILQPLEADKDVFIKLDVNNPVDNTTLKASVDSYLLGPDPLGGSACNNNPGTCLTSLIVVPHNWIYLPPGVTDSPSNPPTVSANVVLAFKLNEYIFPFSLSIQAFGHSYPAFGSLFLDTDYSSHTPLKGSERSENLRLQCMSSDCSSDGTSVTWYTPEGKVSANLVSSGRGKVDLKINKFK